MVLSREPGGTVLSEKIRSLLIDTNMTGAICPMAELFLFYASRFQNVAENITPALERSCVTIIDRYYDSSKSYQGFARGLDLNLIEALNKNFGLPTPDITFWLDAPVEIGMVRAIRSDETFVKWVRTDMKKVSVHIVGHDRCFDSLDKKVLIYPRCDFEFKLN